MKVNITIGRFQPFTKGHLNMVTEGELPCIVYRINSSKNDSDMNNIKVKGKAVKKDNISHVIDYLNNNGEGSLNEIEKEILKRPFTNELIEKELDVIKKANSKYFVDIIYVTNAYEAIADFAAKVSQGLYEPNYLMCGDDRVNTYTKMIETDKPWKTPDGKEYENILKGKLTVNTGKGRTDGVSGTAVRAAIIKKDKAAFSKIMPKGTDSMFDTFVEAFENFKKVLSNTINEYHNFTSLKDYLIENISKNISIPMIVEGGAGGHMPHPIDYTDFTGEELMELVDNLFSGKVETMKEKLDGMNINATMNDKGEVVFVRGNADRNSPQGGMSVKDMETKWEGKEHQLKVFIQSGKIIEQIFSKLDVNYFNPKPGVRKIINCECIIEGKTNVLPYAKDRVAFHGYKIYELTDKLDKNGNKSWAEIEEVEGDVDAIYKAAEGIDAAKPRPNLIIKSVEEGQKFVKQFTKAISKLFTDEGLKLTDSINEWKLARFNKIKPEWLDKNVTEIFNRWFNEDKSFKATEIKKIYPDHYEEVKGDKFCKPYISKVMQPLDNLFLAIGNELIDLLDGFTNNDSHNAVVDILKQDMSEVIELVKQSGSIEIQDKVEKNLNRLQALNNKYNSAEGIVFMYKGRLMKLTGSFAAINQILGARFDVEKLNNIV